MYRPHTTSDRRRYVEDVPLDAPIYFAVQENQDFGISLLDALHSRVRNLQNRDDPMLEGRGPSISIRLEVCLKCIVAAAFVTARTTLTFDLF
jgi:hypothetical protein